jgi:hypothetical protein
LGFRVYSRLISIEQHFFCSNSVNPNLKQMASAPFHAVAPTTDGTCDESDGITDASTRTISVSPSRLQHLEACEARADLQERHIQLLQQQLDDADAALKLELARGEQHAEAMMCYARASDSTLEELKTQRAAAAIAQQNLQDLQAQNTALAVAKAAAVAKLEAEKAVLKAQVAMLQEQTKMQLKDIHTAIADLQEGLPSPPPPLPAGGGVDEPPEIEHYLSVLLPKLLEPGMIERFAEHFHAKCLDRPQFAHVYATMFRQVATFERVTFGSKVFAVVFLEKVQRLHDNDEADRPTKLANVRLVGHLFRSKALVRGVLHTIFYKALFDHPASNFPSETSIEVAAQLSDVVGDLLVDDTYVDHVIGHFREWCATGIHPYAYSTVRMMQDVLDLHDAKWVRRPATPPAAAAAAAADAPAPTR